ncbi:hypothetical protein PUN28_001386 [Cardiocondyla obscurior]|uniref:Secreted protein n=1 Tax=Cardiocondyla obscurior TaxID=286306 RepID=A0AAW2H521_9HYME
MQSQRFSPWLVITLPVTPQYLIFCFLCVGRDCQNSLCTDREILVIETLLKKSFFLFFSRSGDNSLQGSICGRRNCARANVDLRTAYTSLVRPLYTTD